jgi:lipopolysaccharide transport system ATP-binding protein
MSSDAVAITAAGLGKCYEIYERPSDRLRQMLARGKKRYCRDFWALRDVSFQVRKGETIGIVGKNGSGKSTLLQLLCGTLNPTQGRVQVAGKVAALLELGAGFSPEFTGRENVLLAAGLFGLTETQIQQRFDDIAAFADIGAFIDQPVKTYSSGMFVRLAFALVAHVDADILVIDEALAVGDAYFTQKCMRFLRQFRETGTLLFVSHDTAAVTGLCDSALWLDRGKVVLHSSAKKVAEQYLASLYSDELAPAKTGHAVSEQTPSVPAAPQGRVIAQDAPVLTGEVHCLPFSPDPQGVFGEGGARIVNVEFRSMDNVAIATAKASHVVRLCVTVQVDKELRAPIVGFSFKDRLGQILFGSNTFLAAETHSLVVQPDTTVRADFIFKLPLLPTGDYSIAAAVASGSQASHVQHQWIHDAMIVKAFSDSAAGLVGLPMERIEVSLEG